MHSISERSEKNKYYLLMASKQTCLQIPICSIFHENPDALTLFAKKIISSNYGFDLIKLQKLLIFYFL